jgi:hypothetical protein
VFVPDIKAKKDRMKQYAEGYQEWANDPLVPTTTEAPMPGALSELDTAANQDLARKNMDALRQKQIQQENNKLGDVQRQQFIKQQQDARDTQDLSQLGQADDIDEAKKQEMYQQIKRMLGK